MPVRSERCRAGGAAGTASSAPSGAAASSLVPPPPINTAQPGVATSLLYSGAKFRGQQRSKGNAYEVEVVMQVRGCPASCAPRAAFPLAGPRAFPSRPQSGPGGAPRAPSAPLAPQAPPFPSPPRSFGTPRFGSPFPRISAAPHLPVFHRAPFPGSSHLCELLPAGPGLLAAPCPALIAPKALCSSPLTAYFPLRLMGSLTRGLSPFPLTLLPLFLLVAGEIPNIRSLPHSPQAWGARVPLGCQEEGWEPALCWEVPRKSPAVGQPVFQAWLELSRDPGPSAGVWVHHPVVPMAVWGTRGGVRQFCCTGTRWFWRRGLS